MRLWYTFTRCVKLFSWIAINLCNHIRRQVSGIVIPKIMYRNVSEKLYWRPYMDQKHWKQNQKIQNQRIKKAFLPVVSGLFAGMVIKFFNTNLPHIHLLPDAYSTHPPALIPESLKRVPYL